MQYRHSHCANGIYIHTNTAHTYRVVSSKSVRVGLAHRTSGPASPATRFGSVLSRVAAVLLVGPTVSRGAYRPIKLALVLCGVSGHLEHLGRICDTFSTLSF